MLDPKDCPENIKESLKGYVEQGHQPGGFLIAVLSNDLVDSIGRADGYNIVALPSIVSYVYWKTPRACWGSREDVRAWLNGGWKEYAKSIGKTIAN